VRAPRDRVWDSVLARDLASSAVSRALLTLRGYGSRVFSEGRGTFPERIVRFGFTRLEEDPGREVVFGIVGKFWRYDGGLRRIPDRQAFLEFAEAGFVKGAWNVRVEEGVDGDCDVSTETRVECLGPDARRKFHIYWALIRPFSAAIRIGLLRGIKRRAESGAS